VIRGLYRLLTEISGPALPWWLRWRARRTKEDPARIAERYGIASRGRPAGPLLWLHAASIGESLSVLPLLEALVRDGWSALVTTGTTTSAALLAERLPPQATHQYLPLDRPSWIRRFLDHWRPDMVVWTESELWPNTLAAIAARGLPAALINGRLSDRAVARRRPSLRRTGCDCGQQRRQPQACGPGPAIRSAGIRGDAGRRGRSSGLAGGEHSSR
jgi:3-deoxy-D-manno-octulosonic-acid transferase